MESIAPLQIRGQPAHISFGRQQTKQGQISVIARKFIKRR